MCELLGRWHLLPFKLLVTSGLPLALYLYLPLSNSTSLSLFLSATPSRPLPRTLPRLNLAFDSYFRRHLGCTLHASRHAQLVAHICSILFGAHRKEVAQVAGEAPSAFLI